MNHQKPTIDPFTDPKVNDTTLTKEMPPVPRTSTSDPPSSNASPTSEARIAELEKELAESKKREETLKTRNKSLKTRNKSLKTRIKSLKNTNKKKDARIEHMPAFTLDIHIFNDLRGSG
jgi:septal ring factor EnvC (AmiA/AmiB activator)